MLRRALPSPSPARRARRSTAFRTCTSGSVWVKRRSTSIRPSCFRREPHRRLLRLRPRHRRPQLPSRRRRPFLRRLRAPLLLPPRLLLLPLSVRLPWPHPRRRPPSCPRLRPLSCLGLRPLCSLRLRLCAPRPPRRRRRPRMAPVAGSARHRHRPRSRTAVLHVPAKCGRMPGSRLTRFAHRGIPATWLAMSLSGRCRFSAGIVTRPCRGLQPCELATGQSIRPRRAAPFDLRHCFLESTTRALRAMHGGRRGGAGGRSPYSRSGCSSRVVRYSSALCARPSTTVGTRMCRYL